MKNDPDGIIRLILAVDHTVDVNDLFMVAWQMLATPILYAIMNT